MRTNRRIVVFILTVISSFMVDGSSIFLQANSVSGKSPFLLTQGNDKLLQGDLKYQYVGAEKCASVCHNNEKMGFQYDIMKNDPHSKAYYILDSKKGKRFAKNSKIRVTPQESTVCLKCHVTGDGLDSSYFAPTYKKEEGVTCEACHKSEIVTKAFLPKETDCIKCHNNSVHKVGKFDFADKCAKITPHPRKNASGTL